MRNVDFERGPDAYTSATARVRSREPRRLLLALLRMPAVLVPFPTGAELEAVRTWVGGEQCVTRARAQNDRRTVPRPEADQSSSSSSESAVKIRLTVVTNQASVAIGSRRAPSRILTRRSCNDATSSPKGAKNESSMRTRSKYSM